jgi:tetratricopeptide (TPR) repeat protein
MDSDHSRLPGQANKASPGSGLTASVELGHMMLMVLILLILSPPVLGRQEEDSHLAAILAAAQQAQARSDFAAAAEAYQQAVKIRADIPELWANLGLMEHETGNYAAAIEHFQKALRLKPSLYVPNLFLGIDYVKTNRAKEAIPFLLAAEKLNRTDPEVYLALGRAYYSLGRLRLAVHEYRRAMSLSSEDSSGWFDLGMAYLAQVERDARLMSVESHDSAYAKALFAESLTQQSRYKEAVDLYKQIVASGSRPPCMHSELGLVYLQQHDHSNAQLEFAAEEQEKPGCALATLGRARSFIENNSNAEALRLLEELWNQDQGFVRFNAPALAEGLTAGQSSSFGNFMAQQHNSGQIPAGLYASLAAALGGAPPQNPSLATATANEKDADGAGHAAASTPVADPKRKSEKDYAAGRYGQCAGRLKNNLPKEGIDTLLLLAACSFLTGDYQLASDASSTVLAASPHSLPALYWSIKANEQLAFASLGRFQLLEPDSAKSHILLGDAYRQQRRYEKAQVEYRKALEISPNDPAALQGLASAYLGAVDAAKTIETAETALRRNPDDPELNLLMGEALVLRFDFASALPYLKKSLGGKPQLLPRVHALLGEAELLGELGQPQDAINDLKLGLASDEDGHVHYQLSRAYLKIGDAKDASAAVEQMKLIQRQNLHRAVSAVEDSSAPQ